MTDPRLELIKKSIREIPDFPHVRWCTVETLRPVRLNPRTPIVSSLPAPFLPSPYPVLRLPSVTSPSHPPTLFPQKGISFKDVTTLLLDPPRFQDTVDLFAARLTGKKVDAVVGFDARGFIFGAPLALALKVND